MSLQRIGARFVCHNLWKVSTTRLTAAVFSENINEPRNANPLTINCRWSRLIKKKITRLTSDIDFMQSEVDEESCGENDKLPVRLVNRNPRNLEQLQFERKPLGFELDTPSVCYWNKLVFHRSGQHMKAKILHCSGSTIISVSTKDFMEDSESSSNDVNTAINMGMILAKRCLESGILYVHTEMTQEELQSQKVQQFLNALRTNGLILKEPNFISPRRKRDL